MAAWVSGAVAQKLGTSVEVGRVSLGLPTRLVIDDVLIRDQRQQPMLSARRMAVKMELLPLLDGKVNISSAQLFGAEARLYRDSAQAVPNYQFALDALSSSDDDKESSLFLHIGSLIVRRLTVNYDQLDAPQTPGHLNPRHLTVSDISAHVLLPVLNPDSLCLNLKRLALNEKSGLKLEQLKLKLEAGRKGALLSDFALQLPHSTLNLDTLHIEYQTDSLLHTIRLVDAAPKAVIDLSDLKSILPPQVPTGHTLAINAQLSATSHAVDCPQISISTTDHTLALQASGSYTADEDWQAAISRLDIASTLLDEIRTLFPTLPQPLTRLGNASLTAQAYHDPAGTIVAKGDLQASVGRLRWNANGTDDGKRWQAHVDTDSLDLHRLFDNPSLGTLAASLDLMAQGGSVSAKGQVPLFFLNGYGYRNILLDGTYDQTAFSGRLQIDDPCLKADVEGGYWQTATPRLRLTGDIGHLAPQSLHLSDRWGNATFAAIVDADFTATSLADAQGTIDLDDFIMVSSDTTRYHLDNLHLRSGYDDTHHYIRLNSDFGEVFLKGNFNLATLPQSIASLIPMLPAPKTRANNDFMLTMRLSDSQWMQQLLSLPLELRGPLNLDAHVSNPDSTLDVEATIPAFGLGGNNFSDASLQLTSNGDSTLCNMSLTRSTDNGKSQRLHLQAQATRQQLTSSLNISTSQQDGGTLNTITSFYKNEQGQQETHVRLLPSAFTMMGTRWELEPCDILYSDSRMMVDQFTLHHGSEHIIIDGIASKHATDTLMVDLNGVDVAYVLDLVNFHAVDFDGRATGKAYVCRAFNTPAAWADLCVDDFHFLHARMGTLEAHADWNTEEGQIDIDAAIDNGADAQTYIDGYVSPRKQELDLGIRARGTTIGFLHYFTNSFISQVEGKAEGDIRVYGPLKEIDLMGDVVVNGKADVIPLGTTYYLQGDTVRIADGRIAFDGFHLADRDGHQALVSGAITHHYLKDFAFDVTAQCNSLLAYDFPRPETGTMVGGTVWANGTAVLRGTPADVRIDCDITPAPGSIFYYNTANPDAISQQQFITWGARDSINYVHTGTPVAYQPAPVASKQSGDVRVNLRINATPEATLHLLMDQQAGDFIALHGNGTFQAAFYNKGPFQLFGTYDVERGIYSMTIQNILKKNFQFQPGSTIIFGGDPFQATLNLKALYPVNAVSLSDLGLGNTFSNNTIRVNCLMNILGTAGEPRVEFDLEMPTVNSEEQQMIRSIMASEQELNQQVVYLLGIGRFYTQGANNSDSQAYGQTELAMQSLLSGTVSSQINQLLSQVIKNDDWNFGANISTGNEGWHNAEYEGLVSGRMLNNRLLINGQFGYRDNATHATPSFIGDFDLQYLLTPGGSVALKAYNQTNDRYFTHSSLNTQGIGLIMKKEFNGLGDLFTIRKKKTKDDKRVEESGK